MKIGKKGIVWNKLGNWILLLILLIIIILIVGDQRDRIYSALDSLRNILRFGG